MKRFISYILFAFVVTFSMCHYVAAQSPTQIRKKCPNTSIYAQVGITALGDINVQPCTGRSTIFTQTANFTNATVIGLPFTASPLTTKGDLWGFSTLNARVPVGANGTVLTADSTNPLGVAWAAAGGGGVTGSGTANFIPRFTAASVIGNTPFSWNGTTYTFQNTTLTSTFPFSFNPTSGAGTFSAGASASSFLSLTQATGITLLNGSAQINLDSKTGFTNIGDISSAGNSTRLLIFDSPQIIELNAVNTRIKDKIAISNTSDCVGQALLDAGGTFDLTTTNCGSLGGFIALATGVNSTGIITVDAGGVITSSVGVVDSGAFVNYWIIYRY